MKHSCQIGPAAAATVTARKASKLNRFIPVILLLGNLNGAIAQERFGSPATNNAQIQLQAPSPNPAAALPTLSQASPFATNAAITAIPGPQLQRLAALEDHFYCRDFPGEDPDKRMSRLEKLVFGEPLSGGIEENLSRLEQFLQAADPEGKHISLNAAKAPVPNVNLATQKSSERTPRAVSANQTGTCDGSPARPATGPVTEAVTGGDPPANLEGKQLASGNTKMAQTNASSSLKQEPVVAILHVSQDRFAVSDSPQELVQSFSKAIRYNPQIADYSFQRAKAFIQLGRFDRALVDLSDAIQKVPNNPEYYLARAFVFARLGDSVTAQENLNAARFYKPDLPQNIDFAK
jgi:tetratricopeptide (TPR) repeat protein